MSEVRLRFKGQLLLPSESGPGLRVDLEVAGHHLAVESEDGELGAWPLEAVRVRRLEGDTFEMKVAGEDLHFIADDTIAFAYSGMPAIEQVTGFNRSRGRLRGLLSRFGTDSPKAVPVQGEQAPGTEQDLPPRSTAPVHQVEPVEQLDEPEPVSAEIRTLENLDETDEAVIDVTALYSDYDTMFDVPAQSGRELGLDWRDNAAAAEVPLTESHEPEEEDGPSCPALTSEGLPCRSPILGPSGYCYSHDPDRAVEDGYRKALEARARMKRKGTAQLTKTYSRLEKAMREVERGELEPDIAVAMAQIARTMCAILDLDDAEPEDQGENDLTPRF